MSYIVTIDPGRSDMRAKLEDLDSDRYNNNIYKTKLDLEVKGPRNGIAFQAVKVEKSLGSKHDRINVKEDILLRQHGMEIDSANISISGESRGTEDDVGVETKSCGKISALISQFNKVEKTSPQPKVTCPKVPAKKWKMDFQNVVVQNSGTETVSTASTTQDAPAPNKIAPENTGFSVVNLHFKVHSEDNTQFQKSQVSENTKPTPDSKKSSAINGVIVKPLVKPRIFKNDQTPCAVSQPQPADNPNDLSFIKSETISPVQLKSPATETSNPNSSNSSDKAIINLQEDKSLDNCQTQSVLVKKVTSNSSNKPENQILPSGIDNHNNSEETKTQTRQDINRDSHREGSTTLADKQTKNKNDYVTKNTDAISKETPLNVPTIKLTKPSRQTEIIKQELLVTDNKLITDKLTTTNSVTSSNSNDLCKNVPAEVRSEEVTTSNLVNSDIDSYSQNFKDNCDGNEKTVVGGGSGTSCDGDENEDLTSGVTKCENLPEEDRTPNDRISVKLDMLKSELMAMRKMDLVLLRQLINISQTMQRIHQADSLKVSRSLSFLNPNKTMSRRCRPVERQNSAPHCADRRRFLFSNLRSSTEDDYRDSLSSFDESEADSAQSEIEESCTSLTSILSSSPRTAANRRKFFQSHDLTLSLDVPEDAEQNYEDILKRNVRLWKMSYQTRHQSVQEEVDVWF